MGTGVLRFHGVGGGLGGDSHSSFESKLVSEDECVREDEVSEIKASKDGSMRGGETRGDFEGNLWIGE